MTLALDAPMPETSDAEVPVLFIHEHASIVLTDAGLLVLAPWYATREQTMRGVAECEDLDGGLGALLEGASGPGDLHLYAFDLN